MNRADLLLCDDCLAIIRRPQSPVKDGHPAFNQSTYVPDVPEVFVAIFDGGKVAAFNGHVDLGTGVRTSLAQIVAEELDLPAALIDMQLGHTAVTPDQGPTIASSTIQVSAVPLRKASAQARQALLQLAAEYWSANRSRLTIENGEVFFADGSDPRRISFGDLLRGRRVHLELDLETPVKSPSAWKIVGSSFRRVDIVGKATGELTFVHDMRVPGMLHGRVIRPPYAGLDSGVFVGKLLESVDRTSVAKVSGLVGVVVQGDFIGVVAEREENAILAAKTLKVKWRRLPPLPDMSDPGDAIAAAPAQRRLLLEEGDVEQAAKEHGATTIVRTFYWPYQMHASIGPSCGIADYRAKGDGRITVWSGTQNPVNLRLDLSRLVDRDEADIDIVRMEASGCYGRNCADDVCADALLLSRAVSAPVRVQLSRADEHTWEPKGAGQVVSVSGTISEAGEFLAYDFATRYPSNDAPLMAALLTGTASSVAKVVPMGDRTAVNPYRSASRRFYCDDVAPLVRAAWLRGVSALPNSFAHDCFMDELASVAGQDPLEFRLKYLEDARARELLDALAARVGWKRKGIWKPGRVDLSQRFLHGRGIAYARYVHGTFPGFGAAWAAWVVELVVDRLTGAVNLKRVVVAHDAGTMINPDGVRHQIHGNVIQIISRTLKERVRFVDGVVSSREWSSYPILTFPEVPAIDVLLMPRQGEEPLGAGESASVPGPSAIANAIFDAAGIRCYAPPFTPEVIRAALRGAGVLMSPDDCAVATSRTTLRAVSPDRY
ncbi:xanthine dehydrogenase family protein molybdopterin-binding subunit [Burkholderia sp. BCC1977]|uniref:xanthine dehydrogenase family protein molybdopterin-binding subunit n=1 Tax=Burkholderia sp. BCC1977 TaxID=2817440 RepID=UPI002ABE2105|nr:molybdopterin cofactor-binding domain-containing protein [Burkholderia sp. BCC1977]